MKRKKVLTLLVATGVLMFAGCQKTATDASEPVAEDVKQQTEEYGGQDVSVEAKSEDGKSMEMSTESESEEEKTQDTLTENEAGEQKNNAQNTSTAETSEQKNNAQNTSTAEISNQNAETATLQDGAKQSQQSLSDTYYVWQEVTITLPSGWKDAVVIKETENGVSFYQKSSYVKEEGMGYLCSVERMKEYRNYGAGETLAAYTDSGIFYYVMRPTDVTCDMSNDTIMQEYEKLMDGCDVLKATIKVDKNDIYYDADQYELPASNIVKLEEGHLDTYTDNDLWIARNEIYARHGKIFKNQYLQNYFDSCSWYSAEKTDVSDSELSEVELYNVKLIVAAESAYASAHPYPKQCVAGKEVSASLTGDGKQQKITYSVKETAEYEYSCQLKIDEKTYNLGEYVTFVTPVEDIFYLTELSESNGYSEWEDGLEIAVLDEGASGDPETYFFKYNGDLKYIGSVEGFPFKDYDGDAANAGKQVVKNGFTNQGGIFGRGRIDLIETAYIDAYWWYDRETQKIEKMDLGMYDFQWKTQHELYVDIPLYITMSDSAPTTTMYAQKDVSFIKTDGKEWIFVRAKDGTEGYIHVKDGKVLNVNASAESVFSDLSFFG